MPEETKKFSGAFVAKPELNDNVGEVLLGKKSNNIFNNVCDLDLTSLYPSIILSTGIDPTNQLGRIVLFNENGNHSDLSKIRDLVNDFTAEDLIKFFHKWFGMPDKDEILKILQE